MLLFWLILISVFTTFNAYAWEFMGADDPDFIAAKEAWLADNDDTCDFIALIDKANPAAAWFYRGVDAKERNCDQEIAHQIRSSYWLEDVAVLEPAFERLYTAELAGLERLQFLLNLGEPRQAIEYLLHLDSNARWQQNNDAEALIAWETVSPARAEWLDPELKLFLMIYAFNSPVLNAVSNETWLYWLETACRDNDLLGESFRPLTLFCNASYSGSGLDFFNAYANLELLERSNPYAAELGLWLHQDWRTEPYRTVCNEACPADPDGCLYPAFMTKSAMAGLFHLHPPSELLVTQKTFAASERAAGTIWRGLRQRMTTFPDWISKSLKQLGASQCLAIRLTDGGTRWDRE